MRYFTTKHGNYFRLIRIFSKSTQEDQVSIVFSSCRLGWNIPIVLCPFCQEAENHPSSSQGTVGLPWWRPSRMENSSKVTDYTNRNMSNTRTRAQARAHPLTLEFQYFIAVWVMLGQFAVFVLTRCSMLTLFFVCLFNVRMVWHVKVEFIECHQAAKSTLHFGASRC